MPDTSLDQIEDRLAAVLTAHAPLSTWTVRVPDTLDVALEHGAGNTLLITTMAWDFDVADEKWMTVHRATIEIEAISGTAPSGTICRNNRAALAQVIAAIAADRSLGIGLQDVQELDIAPAEPRGKDLDSASLQIAVTWFTPRGDWFTIP